MRYEQLSQHPKIFPKVTGLSVAEFDDLVRDVLPRYVAAERERLQRPDRQREIGAGRNYELELRDHLLLVVVWLRIYPTGDVLGYLFGVSAPTVSRTLGRVLPLLERAGRDTMRLPDPGRKRRRQFSELLTMIPELSVVVDSFEQEVQRPHNPEEANAHYSGKKKRHTLKSQIAIDEHTGTIADVAESVPGPTADLTVLKDSGLMQRLPGGIGGLGDLAYLGLAQLHPAGLGATPRRKPRNQPRPAEDVAYNTAFAKRRIKVEHTIGRVRRYQAVSQTDRHHRRNHTARVVAIAGLVNRQITSRLPC